MSRALVLAVVALVCLSALAEARLSSSENSALRRKNWGRRVLMRRDCNFTQLERCNAFNPSCTSYQYLSANAKSNYNLWDCAQCTCGKHTECGSNDQCGGDNLCYQCGSGGWNCGSSSQQACGDNSPPIGGTPSKGNYVNQYGRDECGLSSQCDAGKSCYMCSQKGWNCGYSSWAACGEPSAGAQGQTKYTNAYGRDECGSNWQCPSKKCFQCSSKGWNCGDSGSSACDEPNAPYIGQTPPKYVNAFGHDECGSSSQCGGGTCHKCTYGGWNCGFDGYDAACN